MTKAWVTYRIKAQYRWRLWTGQMPSIIPNGGIGRRFGGQMPYTQAITPTNSQFLRIEHEQELLLWRYTFYMVLFSIGKWDKGLNKYTLSSWVRVYCLLKQSLKLLMFHATLTIPTLQ